MSKRKKKLRGVTTRWPCGKGQHADCTGGPVLVQHPDVTSGDAPIQAHPLVRDWLCPCEHHRRTK